MKYNITNSNIINSFLDQLIFEITETGLDVSTLVVDHIAYSTKSTKEYEETLPNFLEIGTLEKEAIISDRRVAVIKLNQPIPYENQQISVVELIEPKKDEDSLSGWEHIEFIVEDYDELLDKYHNLNWDTKHMDREMFSRLKLTLKSNREVKFLNEPVLETIKREDS